MGRVAARPTDRPTAGEGERAFALVVLEERWQREEEEEPARYWQLPREGKDCCCLNNTLAAPRFLLLEALEAFRIPPPLRSLGDARLHQ